METSYTPLALVGYPCYLYCGIGSALALGNNKDILLMVEFNYNITSIYWNNCHHVTLKVPIIGS